MLFDIIRIFLVDHIACGKVLIDVFVTRKRIRVNGRYTSVCGNFNRTAQTSVIHKVNAVRGERIFYRYVDLVGIEGHLAVEINRCEHRRFAFFVSDYSAVFGDICHFRIARLEHNFRSALEIRIESIFEFDRLRREHRERFFVAERAFIARFAYFALVARNVIIRFERFVSRNGKLVDGRYRISFVFARYDDRALRLNGFTVGIFSLCGKRCRSFFLCDYRSVYDRSDIVVADFEIERFNPAFARIHRENFGNSERFVEIEADFFFGEIHCENLIGKPYLIRRGVKRVIVTCNDETVVVGLNSIIALFVELRTHGFFNVFHVVRNFYRHFRGRIIRRVHGGEILTETVHRVSISRTGFRGNDLSDLNCHCIMVIVNIEIRKELGLFRRFIVFGSERNVRYGRSLEVDIKRELESVSCVLLFGVVKTFSA